MTTEWEEIQHLRSRHQPTWDRLYQTHGRTTYRVLWHLTHAGRETLEELNQDVWLSAIQSIASFQSEKGTVPDWIQGIARYKGLSYLRKQYRCRLVCVGVGNDDFPTVMAPAIREETMERRRYLRAAMESLPDQWQILLQQKYLEGMSVQEIAIGNETSPKAVESALTRARRRLREILCESVVADDE